MKMKTYENAHLEIIEISETDLITTSGNNIGKDDGSKDGEWID